MWTVLMLRGVLALVAFAGLYVAARFRWSASLPRRRAVEQA